MTIAETDSTPRALGRTSSVFASRPTAAALCATLLLAAALAALAALATGCGGVDEGLLGVPEEMRRDDGGARVPDAGPAPAAGMCALESGPVTLAGQWAIRAELEVELSGRPGAFIALCPDPQTAPASLVLAATISGDGDASSAQLRFCEIGLPVTTGGIGTCPTDPVDAVGVRITVSAGLERYLPGLAAAATFSMPSMAAGARFAPSRFALLAGAALASPMTDALPHWDTSIDGCQTFNPHPTPEACVPGFAAIRDDDADGHPGVTLEASSNDPANVLRGEGYAALRAAPTLDGTVRNGNCIEGTLDAALEYSLVDASVVLSGVRVETPAVINNTPVMAVRPSSTFRMVRTDGTGANDFDDDRDGTVSCAEIAAHASAFGL